MDEMSLLDVSSYAELIADWPVVVLGVCTVLIVVCALVGILVPDLPDFSDPLRVSFLSFPIDFFPRLRYESFHSLLLSLLQKGFEPRGTAIGQRLVTWDNMVKNTGYKATLANYPFKYADERAKRCFYLRSAKRTFSFLREHSTKQLDWKLFYKINHKNILYKKIGKKTTHFHTSQGLKKKKHEGRVVIKSFTAGRPRG